MSRIYYLILTLYRIVKYLTSDTKRYANILFFILFYKPKTILEIGVYTGRRAKEMIDAAKVFNSKIEYFGFDLFEMMNKKILKEEMSKIPNSKKNIYSKLRKSAKIRLFKGYTYNTLPKLKNTKVDFIFIDGGHAVKTINTDWIKCQKFIKKNTIVVFDDYYLNDSRIIKKFGCNIVVNKISKKIFEKRLCKLTDSFYSNYNNKVLQYKMYYVRKK